MQEAKSLHQAGRLAEAADLYRKILSTSPAHFAALYGLAMARAQNGGLEEAERLMDKALVFSIRSPVNLQYDSASI